jgi:tetratricopeptide (TPR) repeat protein
MPRDTDQYDFFVSYARADNAGGWITGFVEELLAEHRRFTGGRTLTCFFDKADIRGLDDWQHRIHEALSRSRLFLAFISPRYFASEWCRREWRAWIDTEIAKHILAGGAAPIYIVEVPGLVGRGVLGEHEVARRVAELCDVPRPREAFVESAAPVVRQLRRRQLSAVEPFYHRGTDALRQDDLRRVLAELARDLDERAERVRRAADSPNYGVPSYNRRFSGRLDELLELRTRLKDDRAGVICGVHGLGGIGKSELAFTYAHAFAGAYPGGRFLVACEGHSDLRQALVTIGDVFRDEISDEERMTVESYFAAIAACLRERLDRQGHILLVLDNVTDPALVSRQQTDRLTALGPKLHLLATTRLLPPSGGNWLTLGELPEADALELLEKHRLPADEAERAAGRRIVRRLGGFALAVELVAAWLLTHPDTTYARLADVLGLEDLEQIADGGDVELRRHNHQRRLSAVLGPVLDDLQPAERRTMEYAALLPPDQVALPWMKLLVAADFPEVAEPGRLSNPWDHLCVRLSRRALLGRSEDLDADARIVRVHRLVQDLVASRMSAEERRSRQKAVDRFVGARDAALEVTTRWEAVRWEFEPLEALAVLWADTGHPRAAWLLNQIGLRWYDIAEWARAEPLMHRALAIDEKAHGPEHPQVATNLNNLAQLLKATNRLAEAEPLMLRALEIDEKAYGPKHPDVARDLNNLAGLLQATNRLAEAEPLYRRALAIDEHSHGPEHPDVATDLNNLAQLLQATNRLAEAEPLMRRALAIDEKAYGGTHPRVATHLNNLAGLLQATDRAAEAEPLFRRALAIDELSYGRENPNVARDLSNLAGLLHATNRLVEAEPLMRRALAIDEKAYGGTHPRVATHLNNLAGLLHATNRLTEAERLYRRALAIDEHSYGREHPNVARDLNNLARLLQDTNRLAEAEPLLRRALEIFLKFARTTGHPHPHLQTAIENYARLLAQMGRSQSEILAQLNALAAPYGVSLGG